MVLKTTHTLHLYFNGFLCRDRRTGYDGIEGKKETLTFRTVLITDRKFHEENVE